MKPSRNLILGGGLFAAIAALGLGQAAVEARAALQTVEAPRFEVDPLWPKPLPNGWVMGTVIGVGVDSRDHIYIVHRGNINPATEGAADADPPLAECCSAAPPVMEFDQAGNLISAWGGEGEGFDWPASNHGIAIDHLDNVWIGGNGPQDSHIVKFTRDGRFLAQYGGPTPGVDSRSEDRFAGVAKITLDQAANEAYISDGYRNRRVAVLDMTTGEMKRFWGAYGNEPDDDHEYLPRGAGFASQEPDVQFRTPVHCAEPTNDGMVYVCDRPNNRIQVFTKDGTFVKEAFYARSTLGDGSVWDIAFSRDPEQKYMYMADGKNMLVYVIERESLQVLTTFGSGGRQPGQFFAVHSIATDSQGNIYTTETYEGRRLQKFAYRGIGPVRATQGPPWPSR